MVKKALETLNGHKKTAVGSFAATVILAWAAWTTTNCLQVPVVAKSVEDQEKLTGAGLVSAKDDRALIRKSIDDEANRQFEWRDEQRSTNIRLLATLDRMDAKLDDLKEQKP